MVKEWESMDTQEFENNHKKEKLEQKYNEMEREIPRHIYIQKVKEINVAYCIFFTQISKQYLRCFTKMQVITGNNIII